MHKQKLINMKKFLPLLAIAIVAIWVGHFFGIFDDPKPSKEKTEIAITDTIENTELLLVNNTYDTIRSWLTLSIYTDTLKNYFVQNVIGIFGIPDSGSSGNFMLLPKDTLSYTSLLGLSGNLCFGGPPLNCPNKHFPYATNIFEFCLNNNFGVNPQESVEISCVAGVNSYLIGKLTGPNWIVTTGIDTVTVFRNASYGNNTGLYGVFPTGCTNCTNREGAPACQDSLRPDQPNTQPICIIQRPAVGSGGAVVCLFNGFTPYICEVPKK